MDTAEMFVSIAGASAIVAVVRYFFEGEGERMAATAEGERSARVANIARRAWHAGVRLV